MSIIRGKKERSPAFPHGAAIEIDAVARGRDPSLPRNDSGARDELGSRGSERFFVAFTFHPIAEDRQVFLSDAQSY